LNHLSTFFKSLSHALNGFKIATSEEIHMKYHLFISFIVCCISFFFHFEKYEWCVTLICIGMVLCAEMLNTAIENLTDLVTTEHHILAKKAKDVAAGAVLVVSIMSVVVYCIIVWGKL
jgi:undecaprenol kinase